MTQPPISFKGDASNPQLKLHQGEDAITHQAQITHYGMLDMQVCVPNNWTDNQIITFAEGHYPCGTSHGWSIRDGSPNGDPKEVPCEARANFKHIMLDA